MRLSLFTLIVTSTVIAAPAPKAEKPDELYFPVQIGAKRVLVGPGRTETITVTKVEEKGGKYTVTVETSFDELPGRKRSNVYEVSKDGLFQKTEDGKTYTLLKLPYKEGTTWTTIDEKLGDKVTYAYTVGKQEEVEVPAGKYKAIAVEVVIEQLGGETKKVTSWYAAGIGLIKVERNELKEFTPGKADRK
jgi:hypothetical protein